MKQRVDLTELIDRRSPTKDTFLEWFLIHLISQEKLETEQDEEKHHWVEMEMTVNGKTFDPLAFVKRLEEAWDDAIQRAAAKLLEDCMGRAQEAAAQLSTHAEDLLEQYWKYDPELELKAKVRLQLLEEVIRLINEGDPFYMHALLEWVKAMSGPGGPRWR
jgi:hypothetical protein